MIAKGKRLLAFAVVLCLLLCLLPSCGDKKTSKAYVLPKTFETIESGVVGENDNYTLEWDNDYKSIMMYSKSGEKVWGTTPYDFYSEGDTNQYASSPVVIEVVNVASLASNVTRAFNACIEEKDTDSGEKVTGYLSAKKIDNGVEVTYYFDEYHISVPVQFTLRSDSMAVSVNTAEIGEGDDFMLKSVCLAPYVCALENVDPWDVEIEEEEEEDFFEDEEITDEEAPVDDEVTDEEVDEEVIEDEEPVVNVLSTKDLLKDQYLFVPAGNGALVAPSMENDNRDYVGEMYGTDGSRYQPYEYYKKESVKMPVFGVKDGEDAVMGIIESGAEHSEIEMSVGRKTAKFSNVAANFYVRGYDIYADKYTYTATITTRLSKEMVKSTLTVGFYPLTGEDANYAGMAKKYRNYLIDKGMTKTETAQNAYALSLLGNVTTTSLAFGVPYDSTKSMTSFNEASTIIKELAAATKKNPAVQLVGYGKSGLDVGQVAGGFGFAGVSGSKDEYAALTAYAKNNNIPLFTDFDMIYFKDAGNGYYPLFHTAKTATLHKSELYYRMIALRAQDEDAGAFRVLNRSQLAGAIDKLLKKGDKLSVTGYSFSTLGSVAYSDYAEASYQVKKGMAADVQAMFSKVDKAGHAIATDNANDYAAMSSDTIFNVEVNPRYTDVFDAYVPFYQMVFKGYVPMYSEALNLTDNYDMSVLNALASGVGLGYTLLNNYDVSYAATSHENLYSSLYSAKKAQIVETVAKYDDYYKAIANATITNYEVLDNGVTVTTFDNGVIAYTNPTNAEQNTGSDAPAVIAPMSFQYEMRGAN